MRVWIGRLFGGSEPAPAPPPPPPAAPAPAPRRREVAESTADFGVPVTYMTSDIPAIDSSFGYGHLDGRRGVPPENFREFISHAADGDGMDLVLNDLREREQAARSMAGSVRQQRAEQARRAEELRDLAAREAEGAAAVREARARLDAAEQESAAHRGSGSLVQTVLYLAAGVLFIGGDVVMARVIVSDAFGMGGNDAWLFAAGLAMLSVLMKPAYDRLVEKPYRAGQLRRYAQVISALALLSVITLVVLGAFRSEAHGNLLRMQRITDSEELSPAQRTGQLDALEERMIGSDLGRWSFVLSGVLFAMAGAVTLSVGFSYAHERKLRKASARSEKQARTADADARARHADVRAQASRQRADLDQLTTLLADAPTSARLKAEADQLHAEWRELQGQRTQTRKLSLLSLYGDGYELGTVMAGEAAAESAPVPKPRRRPRPFVALRRTIRQAALNPSIIN